MPGRRGGASGAGAAGECIHRSACRSEHAPTAARLCQISRGSTRARRTEPQQPVPAHRLLQPVVHCQPPAHCHRLAQPRPPCCAPSMTSTAPSFPCTGAPRAAGARTVQVKFAHMQNPPQPMERPTAQRAHTASPCAKGAQSCSTAPPRSQPSQLSSAQQPLAAAPTVRGAPMHQAWSTPTCGVAAAVLWLPWLQ